MKNPLNLVCNLFKYVMFFNWLNTLSVDNISVWKIHYFQFKYFTIFNLHMKKIKMSILIITMQVALVKASIKISAFFPVCRGFPTASTRLIAKISLDFVIECHWFKWYSILFNQILPNRLICVAAKFGEAAKFTSLATNQ